LCDNMNIQSNFGGDVEMKKLTLKELKGLKQFTGVNKKGEQATITVNAVDGLAVIDIDGKQKEVKLDSVRRSWQMVEDDKKEEIEMNVKIGDEVLKTKTGEWGTVTEINGRLLTVVNTHGEFPADFEQVEILKSDDKVKVKKVEEPKEIKEPKKKEKPAKPAKKKQRKSVTILGRMTPPEVVASEMTSDNNDTITLLHYEETTTEKSLYSITDIALYGQMIRVFRNNGFTMDVFLYDANGELIHKAEKFSVSSMLDWMGHVEDKKMISRKIRELSKVAKGE